MDILRKRMFVALSVVIMLFLAASLAVWWLGFDRIVCYAAVHNWLPESGMRDYVCLRAEMKAHSVAMIVIKKGTPTSQILELQQFIQQQKSVQSVTYLSGAEALQKLRDKYKDNPLFLKNLEDVGPDPLNDTLQVTLDNGSLQKDSYLQLLKEYKQGQIIENVSIKIMTDVASPEN